MVDTWLLAAHADLSSLAITQHSSRHGRHLDLLVRVSSVKAGSRVLLGLDASWRQFCVVSVPFGVVYGQELVSVLEEGTGSAMS